MANGTQCWRIKIVDAPKCGTSLVGIAHLMLPNGERKKKCELHVAVPLGESSPTNPYVQLRSETANQNEPCPRHGSLTSHHKAMPATIDDDGSIYGHMRDGLVLDTAR